MDVRRVLGWATTLCVAILLVRYRSEWLAVTAWVSHRALAWIGNLVGVASRPSRCLTPGSGDNRSDG